jgi:streptogramin lyase
MFSGSKGIDFGYLVTPGSGGFGTTVVSSFGPDGNFYVGEYSGRVLRYDGRTGAFIDVFVGVGTLGFQFLDGLAFGPDGNLYTVSSEFEKVLTYDGTTGAFISEFIPYVSFPSGIRFGPDGNLYVCSGNSIKRFNGTTGAFIDDFVEGGGLYLPNDLEFVTMPAPFPEFAQWQYVPRWLQVIGIGILIGLVFNLLQPRVGNRFGR